MVVQGPIWNCRWNQETYRRLIRPIFLHTKTSKYTCTNIAFFQFICIFAIITNLYPYEKHTSVRVESICGRIQKYDLGESSVVVDSPESSHSFSRVADVLLPARIVRQDGWAEKWSRGEGADEMILLKTENRKHWKQFKSNIPMMKTH